jgi:hypothetical protein
MGTLCHAFYHDKTMDRLAAFDRKYPDYQQPATINGASVPPLSDLLELLPWKSLDEGVATFVHGDLQFDNIIHDDESDRFLLLDWRQDFAGVVEYGDIYYDLAKLLGGIILDYDYIKAGRFSVEGDEHEISTFFERRPDSEEYESILKEFVSEKQLDWRKVRMLVGLIFLNMSPLHHPPFDIGLRALGAEMLAHELNVAG